MNVILALAAFSLIALGSQAVAADPTVGFGEDAQFGELRIRPLEVVEDDRCPVTGRCSVIDPFVLRVAVIDGGNVYSRGFDLKLGKPEHVANGKLTLTAVAPGIVLGADVDMQEAYRFTFSFKPDNSQ